MREDVTQTAWEVDALIAWFRDQQLPQPIVDDAVRIVQDAIAQARREAWDEGERAGRHNAHNGDIDPMVENPYRAALDTATKEAPR